MQKFYLLFTAFIFAFYIHADGQNFAPLGATWYYQDYSFSCQNGYIKIEAVRDTMIDGKYTTILENSHNSIVQDSAYLYIHESNNQVYFYEEGTFKLLFDFNLEKGDTFRYSVPKNQYYYDVSCNRNKEYDLYDHVAIIDSVETMTVDGQTLKVLFPQTLENPNDIDHCWGAPGEDRIVERIGRRRDGLLGSYCIQCLAGCFGYLRCYSDGVMDTMFSTEDCDAGDPLNSTAERTLFRTELYPNPTDGSLFIESEAAIQAIELYDTDGRLLLQSEPDASQTRLSLDGQKAGLYFLRIQTRRGAITHKVVRENPQ
ncbi:MAG: T9SS type A sorting domain-containing protein [Bacteroidota bacterium]